MKKRNAIRSDNAEVVLYGANYSAGYFAVLDGRTVGGSGEPLEGRNMNDAMWLGMFKLGEAGHKGGAWVYAPGGELRAYVERAASPPYYGKLNWEAAPMLVLSVDDILAAAET